MNAMKMRASVHTDTAIQNPVAALNIDRGKLERYLRKECPNLFQLEGINSEVNVYQFTHGQSNPTYSIQIGGRRLVLRKQPPGKLLHRAHQVTREARLVQMLSQHSAVPVPRVHAICEDHSILGSDFYVMDHISGVIYTDPSLPTLLEDDRRKVYEAVAKVLAAIHTIVIDDSFMKRGASRLISSTSKIVSNKMDNDSFRKQRRRAIKGYGPQKRWRLLCQAGGNMGRTIREKRRDNARLS
jgi:aminoglycoside phosphotransferase (APT) family kinase protein